MWPLLPRLARFLPQALPSLIILWLALFCAWLILLSSFCLSVAFVLYPCLHRFSYKFIALPFQKINLNLTSMYIWSSKIFPYLGGAYDKFPDVFVCAFRIGVDSWKFSILLLYILWDNWPIFMSSASNVQLQQQLEYTLVKPDCHCWWISKMQSDTLEERYAIKFCFKLGKKSQKRMKYFRLLFGHLAWIEHQFLSGIRDSRKAGSL